MCLRLTVSCKDRKISKRNGNLALVVQKGGKPYSGNKSIDFGGTYPLGDYNFIYLSFEQLGPGVQEHNSSLKRLNGYRSKRAFLSFKTFLVIAIKISTKYQFLCDTTHGRNDSPKQNANVPTSQIQRVALKWSTDSCDLERAENHIRNHASSSHSVLLQSAFFGVFCREKRKNIRKVKTSR